MGSEQTTRWKHTDTHADLRAFLGDAAGLFNKQLPAGQRDQSYLELVHEYGLSSTLAVQAISALELSHGDSHVAYELLAQWSIDESSEAQPKPAARIARRLARLDEQPTHDEGLALEQAAWSEVEAAAHTSHWRHADDTTVEQIMGRRFEEHVRSRLNERASVTLDQAQQYIAIGVREFGMRPDAARQIFDHVMHEVALQRAAAHQSRAWQAAAAASPDTLPDLECIIEEEADLLERSREKPVQAEAADDGSQSQRDAFRDYVDQRLENIRGNLVDARHWKKWTDHGTVQYGLTSNDAAHLIEERSHKRRMKVLTPQRAVDQLTTLAGGLYHRYGRYTAKAKSRLMTAANQLGVDAAEVRRILDAPPPQPVVTQAHTLPSYRIVLAASGLAASAMLAFFLWVAFSQGPPGERVSERPPLPQAAPEEDAHEPFRPPVWWDRQTVAAAEVIAGDSAAEMNGFSAESAAERKEAALALLEEIDFGSDTFLSRRDQFRQVFVGYLALEPEQHVALSAFEEIAGSVNDFSAQWPARPSDYTSVFWRLDVLLGAIESPLTTRTRADAFAAALAAALQVTHDAGAELLALRSECSRVVTERCFRVMMNSVDRTPQAILTVHASLSLACRPFVSPDHVDRFESMLLCSLLQDGRKWSDFQHLVRHQIGSPDAHNVLRFVRAYEEMKPSETRDQLGNALLSRVGLRRQERTPGQTARVIRTALEHGRGNPFIDRWEQFTFDSERLLAQHRQLPQEAELPQAVLEAAHRNLLGTALSLRNQSGDLAFDQFAAEGAAQLIQPAAQPAGRWFPPAVSQRPQLSMPPHVAQGLLSRCQALAGGTSDDQEHDWEIVIRIIDRWEEIPPPVATLLSHYILSPLASRLHGNVIADARRLLDSTALQMGIAETIEQSPLEDDVLAARLSTLLGRTVAIAGPDDRAEVRATMLLAIQKELAAPSSPLPRGAADLTPLREQLTRIYRAKARLLDVSPGAYLTATNPAAILAATVDHTIAKHSTAADPQLDAIHAAMDAARFRARSELEETVLMQRVWIDLLTWRVGQVRPAAGDQARAIAAELAASPGDSLLAQLFSGEAAELELWLIRNDLK